MLLHMDEEPYNFATWHALRCAIRHGVNPTFFAWQNILRRYPPPFSWFEQQNFAAATLAIAGNADAAAVLSEKGFAGDIVEIPQFGVDDAKFSPGDRAIRSANSDMLFRIGYAGGLLPEKGIDLLIRACKQLTGRWQLKIAGEGRAAASLHRLITELECKERVHFCGKIESAQIAGFYRELDVLVLPSRTTPRWKEQFGRVLTEAMACGAVVVGSDSGEIPKVIGDAGLIFAENNVGQLRAALQQLLDNPQLCAELAEQGRKRVLDEYTMAQIAERTVEVYQTLCTL